jgi:hypothetical protein
MKVSGYLLDKATQPIFSAGKGEDVAAHTEQPPSSGQHHAPDACILVTGDGRLYKPLGQGHVDSIAIVRAMEGYTADWPVPLKYYSPGIHG